MQVEVTLQSPTVLGKRKVPNTRKSFVLHLPSLSPEPNNYCAPNQPEITPHKTNKSCPPVLINGHLALNTRKKYQCTYPGCDKAYSKPVRLEEHERSHSGIRPFVCGTCSKAYLRETHLHAHSRTHLPDSERPFVCHHKECGKRFWTPQHLRVHMNWHEGAKPFACSEPGCNEAFAKHYQLRAHACTIHAPPGTKPYQCSHGGCTKSFATNQHLRNHSKTHDVHRYTCVHPTCLEASDVSLKYFPTWTALQHHIRSVHPPTCSHPSCNGRVFTSHKGLRAHQHLHDQIDMENDPSQVASDSNVEESERPKKKKRRGDDFNRDWKCDWENCEKDFKSKRALSTHVNVTHLGRRDFVCPHNDCSKSFGYKHLLQRHLVRTHGTHSDCSDGSSSDVDTTMGVIQRTDQFDIDAITGIAYSERAKASIMNKRALQCPHPNLEGIISEFSQPNETNPQSGSTCDYVFTRSYDLRRHLLAIHGIRGQKESLDQWVNSRKRK